MDTSIMKLAILGYPEFPIKSFSERDSRGLPVLMSFRISTDPIYISSHGFSEKFPESVRELYDDVRQMLALKYREEHKRVDKDNAKKVIRLRLWALGMLIAIGVTLLCIPDTRAWLGHLPLKVIGWTSMVILCTFAFLDGLVRRTPKISEFRVDVEFDGILTFTTHCKIKDALESGVFKEVFIATEVAGLKITSVAEPKLTKFGSAVVVGYDGDQFWRIYPNY